MLDVKKTPRRVVKMASVGCVVTLALVATLLITGHAAPQRRAPRGASSQAHADGRNLAEALTVDPDTSNNLRAPSRDSASSSGLQARPQKGVSEVPKKYTPKPPKDTPMNPVKSTPIPPPNPQVYLLPTENVKLVFPDDDETVMAANLRALDDQLGRPSDLHAIILESGEDADTFSRALHDFQERTYNSKRVTETHDPTYQEDLVHGQFQYQALLAHQTKPSKRHHAKNYMQAVPPPLVYNQQPLVQADPFLLQQHPRKTVYRQPVDAYRGHRRRRSVLGLEGEGNVPGPIEKSLSGNVIYPPVLRKTRSPDDESIEMNSDEKHKFGSDESDERPRVKPSAKPASTSSSTQDKASLKGKSKNDTEVGPEKASSITEVGKGPQSPGTASDQNLLDQLALDVSSSAEADDLLDYPVEINGMLVSSESGSAEDDGITGTASPALLMEMDSDSVEISSESSVSKESLEISESLEMSSESSRSVEKSSERPDSSEMSSESSSVEKSSESPESSEKSSESSSSVEKNSDSVESKESFGVSPKVDDSAEKSSESQESSESPDSAELSSEAPRSSEFSYEDTDSSESSSESSSSSQNSFEDPESSEMSSEYPDSSESPDSAEFFGSFELQNSSPMISNDKQGAIKIGELTYSTEKVPQILHNLEISSELSSELFRSSEESPEIFINFKMSPEGIDESRKIFEVLRDISNTQATSSNTENSLEITNSIALDAGALDIDRKNELNSITVAPTENSTDYYAITLDSSEFPFSVELFDAYGSPTDEPVVYSDKTEFFDSSENYVDSMETLQSSRLDEPRVLDDAVKNSMNGKRDFNKTEQYPSGASPVSSGSDGQFEVEDLTGESGKYQDKEMTEDEDSNFPKNFAKNLDAKGFSKLPGKKNARKSSGTLVEAHEKGRGKSSDSSLHEPSGPGREEFGDEFLSNVDDNLGFEATGAG